MLQELVEAHYGNGCLRRSIRIHDGKIVHERARKCDTAEQIIGYQRQAEVMMGREYSVRIGEETAVCILSRFKEQRILRAECGKKLVVCDQRTHRKHAS